MKEKLVRKGVFRDWSDGTIKAVYQGIDGIIETTLLKNKVERDIDVYCVPTHHYCNLGCKMCHLTKEGYSQPMKPLSADSLIESVIRTAHSSEGNKRTENKLGWLSFMGVGDPLLNFGMIKEVFEREEEIKEACEYEDITYALSTMMPLGFGSRVLFEQKERRAYDLNEIRDYVFMEGMPLKIHFSLHNPIDNERKELIPAAESTVKSCLKDLCKFKDWVRLNKRVVNNFEKFHPSTPFEPIEIHYTLIYGQNDKFRHLEEMKRLLEKRKIPIKFLKFNETQNLKKSPNENFWIETLKTIEGLKVENYNPPGHQVGSSCGEFTKHYYHREWETEKEHNEFLEWEMQHRIEQLVLKPNSPLV